MTTIEFHSTSSSFSRWISEEMFAADEEIDRSDARVESTIVCCVLLRFVAGESSLYFQCHMWLW